MWTRSELKERGKKALHRNYWIIVLVTLLVQLLSGELLNSAGSSARSSADSAAYTKTLLGMIPFPFLWIVGAAFAVITAGMLYSVFAGNVFEVGGCRFFEENSIHKTKVALILDGFKNGAYGRNVVTMLLRDVYTILWTLCLIIPGVVKSYEYKLIPYILAENPEISRERAFEISKHIMDGQKWDAFVLDLSFLGWNLLSAITLGIVGVLYVRPYMSTTWAEFYKVNRKMALEKGIASKQELTGLKKEMDE